MDKLLEVINIKKSFGKNVVLNELSFDITAGEFVGLLGINGTGKTTLLKCITQLITMDQGKVLYFGEPLSDLIKESIAFLPNKNFIYENQTCFQAIRYFKLVFKKFDEEKCLQLCRRLNINTSMKLKKLSKGDQEKFITILMLSRDVQLLILDEPMSFIDVPSKRVLYQEMMQMQIEGKSIFLCTHHIDEMVQYFNRILVLKDGCISFDKEVNQLQVDRTKSLYEYLEEELI